MIEGVSNPALDYAATKWWFNLNKILNSRTQGFELMVKTQMSLNESNGAYKMSVNEPKCIQRNLYKSKGARISVNDLIST